LTKSTGTSELISTKTFMRKKKLEFKMYKTNQF
jgi:hypothetical protein